MNKYKEINQNYFGFELFEEILDELDKLKTEFPTQFNKGIIHSEHTVRRIREEYYEAVKPIYDKQLMEA